MKKELVKRIKIEVFAVAFVLLSGLLNVLVNIGKASAFALSPMNQNIVLSPGDSYRESFLINNPSTSDSSFNYKIEVTPYSVSDDNTDMYDDYSDYNQIVDWITILGNDTGTVSPNDSITIEYMVNVPEDAPAGGQYAAIRVSEVAQDDSNENTYGIQENIAIAYLLYAEITGNTVHQGEIESASVPGFIFSGNIRGISSIKNVGNVHGIAHYTMKVYPLFSNEELYTNEEKPEGQVILPGKTLYNESEWNETPAIGIFNVTYSVEFEGVTTEVSKMVIKCPIWLLFVVLAVIAALVIWIVMKIRFGKKKSKKSEE